MFKQSLLLGGSKKQNNNPADSCGISINKHLKKHREQQRETSLTDIFFGSLVIHGGSCMHKTDRYFNKKRDGQHNFFGEEVYLDKKGSVKKVSFKVNTPQNKNKQSLEVESG